MSSLPFAKPLLATEHTEQDRGAEALAFALAQRSAPTALAAVMPLASNPEYEAVAPQAAARHEAEFALRREALQAAAAQRGIALEVQVRRGSELHEEIVEAARASGADLLVIRRRGQRGLLARLLVGEMVSKVLAHAPCDMLVVPRDIASLWQRAVLVAIDAAHADRRAVERAAAVARAFALPLHLLAVAGRGTDRDAAQSALVALRPAASGAPASEQVRIGALPETIDAAAHECGADLIVVARHGSLAQKVIGLARGPVLVTHPSTSTAAGAP